MSICDKMKLARTCTECKKGFSIEVELNDFAKWQSGKHIQHTFPYLSPGERELLISGICGECFDKLFDNNE